MIKSPAGTRSKVTPERCINSLIRFLQKSNHVEKKHGPKLLNLTLNAGIDYGLCLTKKIKATKINKPVNQVSLKEKENLPAYSNYSLIILFEDENYNFKSVLTSDDDIVILIPAPKDKVSKILSLI